MAIEVIRAASKHDRDTMFQVLRNSDVANERQVVKYSEPEKLANGEWSTGYFVAYPSGQDKY